MLEETDFQKEASNIAEFSAYLDSSGMHQVATCPFVYKPFSSRRCLAQHCPCAKTSRHAHNSIYPSRLSTYLGLSLGLQLQNSAIPDSLTSRYLPLWSCKPFSGRMCLSCGGSRVPHIKAQRLNSTCCETSPRDWTCSLLTHYQPTLR